MKRFLSFVAPKQGSNPGLSRRGQPLFMVHDFSYHSFVAAYSFLRAV